MTVHSFHLLRLGVFGKSPCKSCVLTVFHHTFMIAHCAFQCAEVVILVALVTSVSKATIQKLMGRMKILKLHPRFFQTSPPSIPQPSKQSPAGTSETGWNWEPAHSANMSLACPRKYKEECPVPPWSPAVWGQLALGSCLVKQLRFYLAPLHRPRVHSCTSEL